MLTIEQIQAALDDRVILKVARECGLSYGTVWAVARGRTRNKRVTHETVRKLSEYLEARSVGGAHNGR